MAAGQEPANWPEAAVQGGLLSYEVLHIVKTTAELICLSLHHLRAELGDENIGHIAQKYQAWLRQTCGLLLSKKRIGLATPLINTAVEVEEAILLVDQLTEAMATVRETESEYRKLYSFVAGSLREPLLTIFLHQTTRQAAPLTFGAQREIIKFGNSFALIERFEEGNPVYAKLAYGQLVALPYRRFVMRNLIDYGKPTEADVHEVQRAIYYNQLDDAARAAIEEACRIDALELMREETTPYYKRLALKPDGRLDNTLHTVSFRDGFRRIMHRYPDDHGFVTSETESQIDNPVSALRPISDAYIVTAYYGDSVNIATFCDAEPNFFGPGKEKANAFWIAGDPRIVIDKSGNPKYMRPGLEKDRYDQARWIILPARFYQIDEQRQPPKL